MMKRLILVLSLVCAGAVTSMNVVAQTASEPAAAAPSGAQSNDEIVKMRAEVRAAYHVYNKKVKAAKKIYDEKVAAAKAERDKAVSEAHSGTGGS